MDTVKYCQTFSVRLIVSQSRILDWENGVRCEWPVTPYSQQGHSCICVVWKPHSFYLRFNWKMQYWREFLWMLLGRLSVYRSWHIMVLCVIFYILHITIYWDRSDSPASGGWCSTPVPGSVSGSRPQYHCC